MIEARLVIIGASGHGKVAHQIARARGLEVVGFVDRGFEPGDLFLGLPVLAREPEECDVLTMGDAHAFVAVGDNRTREELAGRIEAIADRSPAGLVHPSAVLAPDVELGAGVFVAPGAIVNAAGRLQDGAILNTGATLDHDGVLGPFSQVSPGCALAGNTTLGMRAFVGTGASTVPGITIGNDAVVGAGATVIRDVPEGATVVGVPARPLAR